MGYSIKEKLELLKKSNPKVYQELKEKIRLLYIAKTDFVSLIENHIYMDELGGLKKFTPYEKQKEFVELFIKHHYVIILKSRQVGLSTISMIMAALLMCIYPNYHIGILSKDLQAARDFKRKMQNYYDKLPSFIKQKIVKKNETIMVLENGSSVSCATVPKDKPEGVFRGATFALVIIDEAAFINNMDKAYSAIDQTQTQVRQVAEKLGIPYGIIIISTPNKTLGVGEWYYKRWMDALEGKSAYKPFIFSWKDVPGRDEKWLEEEIAKVPPEEYDEKIEQEINMKFLPPTQSGISKEIVLELQNKLLESKEFQKMDIKIEVPHLVESYNTETQTTEKIMKYKEEVYSCFVLSPPKEDKYYFIGVDIATEHGNCDSAIEVIDEDGNQVFEFYNKDIKVYSLFLLTLKVMDIYPNSIVIFENNGLGNQFNELFKDYISKNPSKKKNVYITRKSAEKKKTNSKSLFFIDDIEEIDNTFICGMTNTSKTRPAMMKEFLVLLNENKNALKTPKIIKQVLELKIKNGKLARANGKFDDAVLAFALANYARSQTLMEVLTRTKEKINTDLLKNLGMLDTINIKRDLTKNDILFEMVKSTSAHTKKDAEQENINRNLNNVAKSLKGFGDNIDVDHNTFLKNIKKIDI